jgi:WD40 repeat protein
VSMNAEQAAFRLSEALLETSGSEQQAAVQALAQTLTRLEEVELRQAVLQALRPMDDPASLDTLWQVWSETRHSDLETLLLETNRPAVHPLALKILSTLKLRQSQTLAGAGPEAVELLLAAATDPDSSIATQAQASLRSLSDPASQEEVCRWVIEHDHPQASQAALQAGFAPHQLQRRALFFLLSEQWQRYETLDFDASLLRAVHQAAEPELRNKIAQVARQAGWAGYIDALAGSLPTSAPGSRRLSELNAAEWEVILALSGRHQRREEAWRLAQVAPPVWSARLLQELHEAGWAPSDEVAHQEFNSLVASATACLAQGASFEKLPGELRALKGLEAAPQLVGLASRPHLITALAFSPQGDQLASGSTDRSVTVWNTQTGEIRTRLLGHSGVVVSLAFSPDGQILASGSADRTAHLWQIDGNTPPHILGGHVGEVAALAFSPAVQFHTTPTRLLATGDPVAIRLWDLQAGRLEQPVSLRSILPVQERGVVSLAFSPDGSLLYSGLTGNTLHIWEPSTGESLDTLMEQVSCWALNPHSPAVPSHPDSQQYQLATGSSYGQARLWQIPPAALLQTLDGRIDGEHMVFSASGHFLAASDRQRIRIWEFPSFQTAAQPLEALEGHTQRITALAFSKDNASLPGVLASGSEDKSLRLWQMPGGNAGSQGHLIQTLQNFTGGVKQILFNPNGAQLACLDTEKLYLLSIDNLGRLLHAPVGFPGVQIDVQRILERPSLPAGERAWLEFALRLYTWQRRFDIEIAEAHPHILIGEFDIDIAG